MFFFLFFPLTHLLFCLYAWIEKKSHGSLKEEECKLRSLHTTFCEMSTTTTSDFVESVSLSSAGGFLPLVEKQSHPQVLVMLLNQIPKSLVESQESVRVTFMILKVLAGGKGVANFNIDKPPPPGTKRDANDYIYNVTPNGNLLAKTYVLINRGHKGAPSEKSACLIPGMILSTSVFKDTKKKDGSDPWDGFFSDVAGEIPDFDGFSLYVGTLQSRSLSSKATTNGGMLQLRKLRPFSVPTFFGHKVLTETLFVSSIASSVDRRMEFMNSEKLSEQTGFAVDQVFHFFSSLSLCHSVCVYGVMFVIWLYVVCRYVMCADFILLLLQFFLCDVVSRSLSSKCCPRRNMGCAFAPMCQMRTLGGTRMGACTCS